jgi:hypothetical protein
MPNERREGLDRRDFMMAAIGLVGASASLASSAGTANAQDTKAPPVGLKPGALQRTVYTGDVIQGKKVISALDVNDLERGKKHAFYFEGVQMPTGQHWYVSVLVAVGAKPGKRVALTSGVHGDEISPVHMIQTVMSQLALRPARSPQRDPLHRKLRFGYPAAASVATGWSEPVPGWELHPLKSSVFHGALLRRLRLVSELPTIRPRH